jgi:hypothetical protein
MSIDRAVIVRSPYAGLEVDGIKKIECRSSNTNIRGLVGIIQAKSGFIIGEVEIIDSFKFTEDDKIRLKDEHKVEDLSLLDKWCYGWVLANAKRYKKPIPYKHPKGAVIWVKL